MVFESIVAYFLDKYLSSYLDNFDSSKLKIGIWSGDVVLENLHIKPNALDEMNLPFRVVLGHLKQLKLKIPWKSLYTESVKVNIDGLTLLIVPKSSTKYDPERDNKERIESKLNEVKNILEAEKAKAEKNGGKADESSDSEKQDTFTERIQLQVIRNLELHIRNIHIRYEDNFSKPEHPFSAGITLDSIQIQTADENWKPTYLKEGAKDVLSNYINKLASLVSFAVYCNSDEKLMNGFQTQDIIVGMQRMITQNDGINYMLSPLSLTTKAVLNMKPRQDNYKRPMFDFVILLESLGLSLNRLQYFDLVDMLGTIDQMALYAKYQKYRVTTTAAIGDKHLRARQRWSYAYRAIVEDQIRPKREQYKWSRIRLVTQLRREYVGLLKKKIKGVKLTSAELETERKCEETLDVFNLVLAKKQADVEIARIAALEKEKPKSTWWNWMKGSSTSKEDQEKLSEAANLSQDEKLKLFDAIGYTEESTFSQYPKDYVSIKVRFLLKKFEIQLIDGEYRYEDISTYISNESLLHLTIDNMELDFSRLPVTSGIKINSSIKSISLTGSCVQTFNHSRLDSIDSSSRGSSHQKPVLIEPDLKDQVFIEFKLDIDPSDPQCDKRIAAKSRSLKIVYHATTINNIVYFFQSSEKNSHSRLKSVAMRKINQVRERSMQYMKNNLTNIRFIDVNIDIEPSYLLIPQNGELSQRTRSLCINFGNLKLKSESSPSVKASKSKQQVAVSNSDDEEVYHSATDDENDLKKSESTVNTQVDVIEASYWKYRIDLKQITIVLIESMDELEQLKHEIVDSSSSLTSLSSICERCYLLKPVDLFFNIHQCVYTDDANLPAWKLLGNLPRIELDLTEAKLEHSLQLVLSLPLPKNNAQDANTTRDTIIYDEFEEEMPDETNQTEHLIDTFSGFDDKNVVELKKSESSTAKQLGADNAANIQAIMLEFSFEIEEITLKLKEDRPVNFDCIELKIASFGTFAQIKTYSQNIDVYLKQISMFYGLFRDVNGEKLYLMRSANEKRSSDLINIRISNTSSDSPVLNSSLHDNCLTRVDVDLCMIEFVVNLIAMKNMLKFAQNLQRYFDKSSNNNNNNNENIISSQTSEQQITNRRSTKASPAKLNANQVLSSDEMIKSLVEGKQKSTSRKQQSSLLFIDYSSLVEYKINAKFDGIRARVCTQRKNYFQANLEHFETTVTGKLDEIVVDLSLNSISILDIAGGDGYNKILSLKEDQKDLIKLQVRLATPPRTTLNHVSDLARQYQREKFFFKNYLNEEHFDLTVKANISKLRVVFLFKHLNTLMAILKLLETEQTTTPTTLVVQQPSQPTTDNSQASKLSAVSSQTTTTTTAADDLKFEFFTRIKLDVTINAPLIIVPESAGLASSALLLDCGVITVRTSLNVIKNYYNSTVEQQQQQLDMRCLNDRCQLPPVIEIQKVTLSKMEISKITLAKDMKILNQLFLVDCLDLKVLVRRSMQPSVFKKIEPLNVEVMYGGLLVSLARKDYTFILQLAQNLDMLTDDTSNSDDPDLPSLKPAKTTKLDSKKQQQQQQANKKQVNLDDAITIVKSNKIASLTVRILIESLRVYLFNDDDQLANNDGMLVRGHEKAFSKMEIKNLQVEMNMFEDTEDVRSNMKMLMLLDNIILDDTRKDKHGKAAIRLIEKYVQEKRAAPTSMLTMLFDSKLVRQEPDEPNMIGPVMISEKNIKGTIECLRLCVNVDYLLLLYEFFVEGLPKRHDELDNPIAVEQRYDPDSSKNTLTVVKKEHNLSESSGLESSSSATTLNVATSQAAGSVRQRVVCELRVEYPQFILYEDQYELKRSNSLIVDGMFHVKIDLDDERIKVHTMLNDLMVRLKSVRAVSVAKRVFKTSKRIIVAPTSLSLSGEMDNRPIRSVDDMIDRKAQSFILDIQDINFNMSPQVLNTSLKMMATIQNSLDQKFKTEVIEVREETQVALDSLFQAVEFNMNEFWFTRQKEPIRRLSSSSLLSSESCLTDSSTASSRTNMTQMIIRTSKIFVKLEADVSEQIPLIGLSLSCKGEVTNWTSKLGMSLTLSLEMAYFNESKSAWEPVIEPVEYKSDRLLPYEITIEMITNELDSATNGELSSRKSQRKKLKSSSESNESSNLLPLRTFHLHSSTSLQIVVTRTFLSMLDTISKTLQISDEKSSSSSIAGGDVGENMAAIGDAGAATSGGGGGASDEYSAYEQEEEMLFEKLKNRLVHDHEHESSPEHVERSSPSHDHHSDEKTSGDGNKQQQGEENTSFNFLIRNELGADVYLEALNGFHFQNLDLVDATRQRDMTIDRVLLKNENLCPIKLANNLMNSFKSAALASYEPDAGRKSIEFRLTVNDSEWQPVDVKMSHLQYNGYYLNSNVSRKQSELMLICETVTNMDKRRIYLRSQIQVTNMFQLPIDVRYPPGKTSSPDEAASWKQHVIKPGKKWCLPIESLCSAESNSLIRVAPISSDGKFQKQEINWHSRDKYKLLEFSKHIFIQVIIEKEPLDISVKSGLAMGISQQLNRVDFVYNIVLLPTVTLYNYLPYTIKYQVDNSSIDSKTSVERKSLEPGESTTLINAKIGSSYLLLEMLKYANSTWYASQVIDFNPKKDERGVVKNEEVNMIDFRSRDAKIITLQYTSSLDNNCLSFSLYAPYWILNQTTLGLEYKFKGYDDDINEIDGSLGADTPIFFKINSRAYRAPKKEILFRVVKDGTDRSDWSGSFLIDTAGNKGTICARSRNQINYEIGVDISLSTIGLTKIIKLTPYYLLINNTELVLEVREHVDDQHLSSQMLLVKPKQIVPFWPSTNASSKDKNAFRIRVLGSQDDLETNIPFTSPFWYNSKHSTLLKLPNNPYTEALHVQCIPNEEIVRTIFKPYSYGSAPVLVLNCLTSKLPLIIKQNGEDSDEIAIMPGKYHMKTWRNPIGKRELVWSCGISHNQVYNLDTIQSSQPFDISPTNVGFSLSFLDGLQKVLMFVETTEKFSEEVVGYKKIKGDEYIMDLDSLGLSLVDDRNQIEILYMSITSSSISWGQKQDQTNKVSKAFASHKSERLEEAYQRYLRAPKSSDDFGTSLVKIDEQEEVDFDQMVLFIGKTRILLERHHAPSVYINFFKSLNQTCLHLMVNKIQIDNQLHESVFPVVFSKIQPPKTVATTEINKPFVEMSMIFSHSQRTKTNEMKYFKVLVQEFFVKLDIMFINALVAIFTDKTKTEKKYVADANALFKEIELINKSFHEMFYSLEDIDIKNEKIYFDFCHISPIKMHLSFSLLGSDAFKDASFLLDNPFFKSIGLVLTDMQDVIFKLGYFEVINSVYSVSEITNEAVEHYKTQVIKQAYILLLGLDVLGNPFGLIRGLAEGVESLFYEPYAGLVQGPGEFAEGMALGIGKLLGSTLGGAAGAFSKITGTLGKGLATLSMDKEFQMSRKKNTDQTFLQNFGQNLVMGVVSGVTGVVEKPIEGAKSGQLSGFLGGLGKGLLGVVTKPTAGLVDFTSQSLEGLRKTVVNEEKIERVRPPRCIYKDSVIRAYRLKEAQGIFILKNLDRAELKDDRLIGCLEAQADSKVLLILTNRHILLARDNVIFTKWVLDWCFELNQLLDVPKLVNMALILDFRNIEKKLFGNQNTIEKVVPVKDETDAKKMMAKIIQARSDSKF